MAVADPPADNGLRWNTEARWGPELEWSREPNIAAVAQTAHSALDLDPEEISYSTTEFVIEDSFTKIYRVTTPTNRYIMRVSLPVEPRDKTRSEVATLRLVGSATTIPVPKVIAYDASPENAIDFEWILMEHMDGQQLEDLWDILNWEMKTNIVAEVAKWMAQSFSLQFETLGSLYEDDNADESPKSDEDPKLESGNVTVGPLVSPDFLPWDGLSLQYARGSFCSSREWLLMLLSVACRRNEDIIQRNPDRNETGDEDVRHTEQVSKNIKGLPAVISTTFPNTNDSENETFTLHHNHITHDSILVDPQGNLTGLLDWKCTATMPVYKAACFPDFLDGDTISAHKTPTRKNIPPR